MTRTRDVNDESRVLVDLTDASRAIEAEVRAVSGQIKAVCQLSDTGIRDLHTTLEALSHPAAK